MSLNLNPWLALLLGILIGWLLEWLLELWFFRKQRLVCQDRLAEVEAQLKTRDVELSNARAHAESLGADLTGLRASAAVPLGVAAAASSLDLQAELPGVALEAPEVKAELPKLDISAPEVELEAAGVGLGGAAVAAGPGVGLVGLAGQEAKEPTVEVEGADVSIDAEVPAVDITLPDAAPLAAHIEADDLTQVKGVGPKYAAQLAAAGITSYAALAHTPVERLQAIVDAPAWRQVDYHAMIADARRLAAAPRRMVVGDELVTLEGIGPVYEAKLKYAGIATFAGLATADEARLAEIIQAPAWRRVNYGEWIAQARLAAAGDTVGLKALQAELFSREGDNIALIGGVGAKTGAALNVAGITTYAALAEATPDRLAEITLAADVRGGNFAAWIEEARLRAAGRRVKRATRGGGATLGRKVPCPQDLSRVLGIGSVYEAKLYEAGIGSYWELSEIADEDLVSVLEIRDFQAVDIVALKADALRLAEETNSIGRYWDGTAPDDFEPLEGIGEVYERRLYDAGICTYAALAQLTPEQLQDVCQAPDWQRPDFTRWIAQARALSGQEG